MRRTASTICDFTRGVRTGRAVRLEDVSQAQIMERAPVINSDEQLLSVLANLEACRAALVAGGNRETAQLVSVAMLELRMKLGGIDDDDLKALCDEMLLHEDNSRERAAKSSSGHRRRPLLRIVK
jgi:hypothetical protein